MDASKKEKENIYREHFHSRGLLNKSMSSLSSSSASSQSPLRPINSNIPEKARTVLGLSPQRFAQGKIFISTNR